jgi:hypothetical protein
LQELRKGTRVLVNISQSNTTNEADANWWTEVKNAVDTYDVETEFVTITRIAMTAEVSTPTLSCLPTVEAHALATTPDIVINEQIENGRSTTIVDMYPQLIQIHTGSPVDTLDAWSMLRRVVHSCAAVIYEPGRVRCNRRTVMSTAGLKTQPLRMCPSCQCFSYCDLHERDFLIHCNQKNCSAVGFKTLTERLDEVLNLKQMSEQVQSIPDMWVTAVIQSGIVSRAVAASLHATLTETDVVIILKSIVSTYCTSPAGREALSACIYRQPSEGQDGISDTLVRRACASQRDIVLFTLTDQFMMKVPAFQSFYLQLGQCKLQVLSQLAKIDAVPSECDTFAIIQGAALQAHLGDTWIEMEKE